MKVCCLSILLVLCLQHGAQAQVCSGPGRTPQTAFPLCGTVEFIQPGVSNCTGSQYPNANCQSGVSTSNSVWYRFTCYQAGGLAFLISPVSPNDDYDWILMDVTGKTTQQILSNDYSISLNYSGNLGTTGCTSTGIGDFNCAGSPRYNQMPAIVAGHDYLLMVTNFTQSGYGYSISFDGSTANLSNALNPTITDVKVSGCNSAQLEVSFSEDVLCSSITSSGSEFLISNGTQVITGVLSECNIQGNVAVKKLIITLQQPLTGGNYNLAVANGSDGNSILDVCLGAMQPVSIPFVVPPQQPLIIKSITYEDCRATLLKVVLTKPVLCSTISSNFGEFIITPGAHPIAAVTTNCQNNFYTDTIRLLLQAPLSLGSYQMRINNGNDGNTLTDTCGISIAAGYTYPFNINPRPAPRIDSVKFDKCSPSSLEVFYNTPIFCSSISANGSDFSITGPAAVNITAATGVAAQCVNSLTNKITLTLSQPVSQAGTYTLGIRTGADGNTLLDSCFIPQSIAETVTFNTFLKPAATFTDNVLFGCVEDTLQVSHPGGNGVNSWQWTFSNGNIVSTPTATQYFPVNTLQATVRLIVSNGQCSDTLSRTYPLNNAFNAAFSIAEDSICINKKITIANQSTGNNLQYSWDYGNGYVYNGQNPPPYSYGSAGTYNILLSVSNNHGCSDDSLQTVHLLDTPQVDFTGLQSRYCTGDSIRLISQITGPRVTSYSWNNGDGIIIQNEPAVKFVYGSQSDYTISLNARDSFCGLFSMIKTVPVFLSPKVDLGKDLSLCPETNRRIGIPSLAGYDYLWSTGAVSNFITTGPVSASYILTVTNNDCVTTDTLLVRVMDTCLLRVPGAFTPNNDGVNDKLKVVNAELAKNFSLKIYDRYGQLVFISTDPMQGWDGTFKGLPAQMGAYIWQVSYINPYSNLPVFDKGSSLLIR